MSKSTMICRRGQWPTLDSLARGVVIYNPIRNVVCISYFTLSLPVDYLEVGPGSQYYQMIHDEISKRDRMRKSQQFVRRFNRSLDKGFQLSDESYVQRFLEHDITIKQAHDGLRVRGAALLWLNQILLYRIGPGEFVMGKGLSGLAKNQPSFLGKIIYVLATSEYVFWKSFMTGSSDNFVATILDLIETQISHCFLHWPTALPNNAVMYKRGIEDIILYHRRAEERFGLMPLSKAHLSMIDAFGDKKKCKGLIKSLKVAYQLTGEI